MPILAIISTVVTTVIVTTTAILTVLTEAPSVFWWQIASIIVMVPAIFNTFSALVRPTPKHRPNMLDKQHSTTSYIIGSMLVGLGLAVVVMEVWLAPGL